MPAGEKEIGSLLICGFNGTKLPDDIGTALADGLLGGVILFSRNYEDREQLRSLTTAIREQANHALIAVDQEGGQVSRFTGDFPCFPSPSYFGDRSDPKGLIEATRVTAENLRSLGVSLNLTPVCDLRPAAAGHVVYRRAYSADPGLTAVVVAEQVSAMKEVGIFSCAKHFPGLESAVGDPHYQLAHSRRSGTELRDRDYLPFKRAIDAGADLVMVTHMMVPAIDDTNAATFSHRFLEDELRDYLGFSGPIMTDDLLMNAVAASRTPASAMIDAILAGGNFLLFGECPGSPADLVASVVEAASSDVRLAAKIADSAARVNDFQQRHGERILL